MRIRHKIFFGYLALVTLSVVLVAMLLVTLTSLNHSYSDLLARDEKVLLQAYNLRASVLRQVVAARTYEQLGDTSLYAEFEHAIEDQDEAIRQIRPLLTDKEDFQTLQRIQTNRFGYTQLAKHLIELAQANRRTELVSLRRSKGEPARLILINDCDNFIRKKSNEVAAKQADLEKQVSDASTNILVGTVITMLITLLGASLMSEGLTAPLRKLMRNVQGISSGDLQTPITVTSTDEIGELAKVLETMRLKLADTQYELENALNSESEARKRIEDINKLKDEFISMVSHELKTPMSYVYNYASALKEHHNSLNEGQRREFLTSIQSEALHLLALIEDIMTVSLLEAGALKHRFVETDLRQITDNAVKDQQFTTRRHTLTVKGPNTLPVSGDPTRLKQVLNNLLSNAIKYSPQGGNIEVRLRPNPMDRTALIYVRDYGIGIRAEDIPKLFDRFTRIERRETMAIPGSGLGLYIAHQIIKAHGGSLTLEQAPGKGTIAQVTVSLAPSASVGTKAASVSTGTRDQKPGIESQWREEGAQPSKVST